MEGKMKFDISYKNAIKRQVVAVTLFHWISIQLEADMLREEIDRLVIGWIEGNHNLIFDTNDLGRVK